ncbi:glycosyltransferase [Sinorhizobium meliloti]|uniref:glycosyltransferase n=1 Tax=Rhizobium meliloti TaxID=382 RepID=UPI0018E6FFDF|nr:glycosyltransferase [Sinorhizobium meliloti]QQF01591.1 glycosyltransferase [Sinorhizobium meliloti]
MARVESKSLLLRIEDIYKYFRRNVQREAWHLAARTHQRLSNALISRGSGKPIASFVVWPKKRRRIYFANVPRGEVTFEIQHRDTFIADERKSIICRFGFITGTKRDGAIKDFGLPRGSDGRLFAYLGGGKKVGNRYLQAAKITIPKFQKWMYVELDVPAERLVNLEKVRLYTRPNVGLDVHARVSRWVENNPVSTSPAFVLYADIDVNVVDGSSVWLSSLASILCHLGQCILVSKKDPISDIILSNVERRENLLIISPADFDMGGKTLDVQQATGVIRALDDLLPNVRYVVLRGTDAAAELSSTRQFRGRSIVYLTDFYKVTDEGITITAERKAQAKLITSQAAAILTQTSAIATKLREIAPFPFNQSNLPPVIPDNLPEVSGRWLTRTDGQIHIGYAGKINPEWGIVELLDWTKRARSEGFDVVLHIVANKISEAAGGKVQSGFRSDVLTQIEALKAQHHQSLNREQSMQLMSRMDYVWCWRPASLEDHTLELSTKLVEMAASGARCLCYPNDINRSTLASDYPYFVRNYDDLRELLPETTSPSPAIGERIRRSHSLTAVRDRLEREVFRSMSISQPRRICFAGHDMKFIHPYLSYLKSIGHEIVHDAWEWGKAIDLDRTKRQQGWADTVFCEWGLANAVWHSQNRSEGKSVFIRVHLQEINDKARRFGPQINIDNVERVIFVSRRVRDQAVKMFGWPVAKTTVIPNFVLTDDYRYVRKSFEGQIKLGMVGIVPQRKRLDRAIDLLAELVRRGHDASLHIKGPRPETLDFMHGPGRRAELDYYYELYRRLENDGKLADRVTFYQWGNDVASWYQNVNHILSPSDFESFHYALADGVLSGCHPLVWPWEEAPDLYASKWVITDTASAASRIETFRQLSNSEQETELEQNRLLVAGKYGNEHIFPRLNEAIGI